MKFSRMSTDVLIRESRIILKFPEWLPIFSGTPDSEDTLISFVIRDLSRERTSPHILVIHHQTEQLAVAKLTSAL